jgi:hypothetical protein
VRSSTFAGLELQARSRWRHVLLHPSSVSARTHDQSQLLAVGTGKATCADVGPRAGSSVAGENFSLHQKSERKAERTLHQELNSSRPARRRRVSLCKTFAATVISRVKLVLLPIPFYGEPPGHSSGATRICGQETKKIVGWRSCRGASGPSPDLAGVLLDSRRISTEEIT